MTRRPDLAPAYRLVALETVDSTNTEAKRLAARGEDEGEDGTLVWARRQTAGTSLIILLFFAWPMPLLSAAALATRGLFTG